MAKRYLYLVRHGNYNTYEQSTDELGGRLTPLGRDQAALTGRHLALYQPLHALHASTMRRAMETAEVIALHLPHLEIQPSRLLWECIPTIPDQKRELFAEKFPHLTTEKVAEQRAIADQAFEQFFQPHTDKSDVHEVLVSHGNLIRYLTCRALGIDPSAWVKMLPFQGGITRFMIEEDGDMMLLAFNETAHIPLDMQTDI